jgi:4,5-DOPA dioxygenase extradiol
MSEKMPALFVGHGSPMNAIEDNNYSVIWSEIGEKITKPEAILSVSAHWNTDGIRISDEAKPKMVYDMYGFPDELYRVKYPAEGSPELARLAKSLLGDSVKIDNTWGIDHGTWSVLRRMYPKCDVPVFQLSVDYRAGAAAHYEIGKKIAALRQKGVMIFGSGNVVHNLERIKWDMKGGQPWAEEFDLYIKEKILEGNHQDIIHYEKAGSAARLSFTTPEHFHPLLCVLGAVDESDSITIFNNSCTMGSLSMTSYLFE